MGMAPRWNPDEIGYFDPALDTKADYEHQGKATMWKNVFLFTDSFKSQSRGRGEQVRGNLHHCLRGDAQRWLIEEIDESIRRMLRTFPDGIDLWAEYLVNRFKDSMPTAMKKLHKEIYTADDAKSGRYIRAFGAMVIRHSKALGMNKPLQHLSNIYWNLDPRFRPLVTVPNERTLPAEWMAFIAEKQEAWQDQLRAQSVPLHRSRLQPPRDN